MKVRRVLDALDIYEGMRLMGRWADPILRAVGIRRLRQDEIVTQGTDISIRVVQDSMFGPVLEFSYGKPAREVWGDVVYRILPLTQTDAELLIREPQAAIFLTGYEDFVVPNSQALEQVILDLSEFVSCSPEPVEMELDLVFASPDDLVARHADISFRSQ